MHIRKLQLTLLSIFFFFASLIGLGIAVYNWMEEVNDISIVEKDDAERAAIGCLSERGTLDCIDMCSKMPEYALRTTCYDSVIWRLNDPEDTRADTVK